jgi:hypothetical protein
MRCNVCWLQLSHTERVCATQCSHVLCNECITKYITRSPAQCPVCGTSLESSGLALIDLVPSSDKIKALCGLDPSFILQVASRAIDFYNFQSDLAHTHDAQELESAKRNFQHQTQQNALAQKDLNSQLRTLKYQLEAIVSERDAQVRLVEELQSRLEGFSAQPTSFSTSSLPMPLVSPTQRTLPIATSMANPSTRQTAQIYMLDQENRVPNSGALPSHAISPYRDAWTSAQHQSLYQSPSNIPTEIPASATSNGDRRTRLFSSASPISHRRRAASPSHNRVLTAPNQPVPTYHIATSAPKHTAHQTTVSSNSSSSSSSRPSHKLPTVSNAAPRFSALGSTPTRPETPLLQRLAGLSSGRPQN